jgi:hypothetical protein
MRVTVVAAQRWQAVRVPESFGTDVTLRNSLIRLVALAGQDGVVCYLFAT